MPRNAMGKVLKFKLREMVSEENVGGDRCYVRYFIAIFEGTLLRCQVSKLSYNLRQDWNVISIIEMKIWKC